MKVEKAEDVQKKIDHIISVLGDPHLVKGRILCVRSYGSKANAYARIWEMPKVWKVALDINTFYVIEVLSENYDPLPEEEKIKVLIHELLHIPKTFSGALRPHRYPSGRIDQRTVNKLYRQYMERVEKYEKYGWLE